MPHFLVRLNPPRPTFAADMTEDERQLMQTHAAYWYDLTGQGIAVLFGPVLDPAGAWGLGIVEADSDSAVRDIAQGDPVVTAEIGFSVQIMPMQVAAIRGAAS